MPNLLTLNLSRQILKKLEKYSEKYEKPQEKCKKTQNFASFWCFLIIYIPFFHVFCTYIVTTLYVPWYGTKILENE